MHWSFEPRGLDGWDHQLGAPSIVGFVLMIILWAAVITALVFAVRALIAQSRRRTLEAGAVTSDGTSTGVTDMTPARGASPLLPILEERYAKGEIDRDEFLQRKQDLSID